VVSKQQASEYMNTFWDFAISKDIPTAIAGNANYLAALGLSTYTEHLAGLYAGELRSMANGAKISMAQRYMKFLQDFFPVEYCNIDNQLKSERGLYGVIRSGLTHEYFIKKKSQIVMEVSQPLKCGIIYDLTGSPQLVFVVKRYFEDFKNALDLYSKKLDSDPSVLKDFGQALSSVNSSLLQQGIPSGFRSSVSGKVYL
jgi:hypothetical protein